MDITTQFAGNGINGAGDAADECSMEDIIEASSLAYADEIGTDNSIADAFADEEEEEGSSSLASGQTKAIVNNAIMNSQSGLFKVSILT